MSASIRDAFEHAMMAVAAYGKLEAGMSLTKYVDELKSAGMTDIMATKFAERYAVIASDVNTNVMDFGYQGVIFQDNQDPGHYVLANRGTASIPDVVPVDLALFALGVNPQTNPMYRLLEQVKQYNPTSFTVTGHSLGGYLTTMASRTYPDLVDYAYTYNGAGVDNYFALPQIINKIIGAVGGHAITYTDDITNYITDENPDIVTSVGFRGGEIQRVSTDMNAPFGGGLGHSSVNLANALLVTYLVGSLDQSLTISEINALVEAAHQDETLDGNGVVAYIARLLGRDDPLIIAGNESALQQVFFGLIPLLDPSRSDKGFEGNVISLHDKSPSDLFDLATRQDADGALIRHALLSGSSFALSQPVDPSGTLWPALQTVINDPRLKLDHFDADIPVELRGAHQIDSFWSMYGKFYQVLMKENVANGGAVSSAWRRIKDFLLRGENVLYSAELDGVGHQEVRAGLAQEVVRFGNDNANVLNGAEYDDHLYGLGESDTLSGFGGNDYIDGGYDNDELQGGGGDDILIGGYGDDSLRGNVDNDTLIGGHGTDTYFFQNGDGLDIVIDADQNSVININGLVATGSSAKGTLVGVGSGLQDAWKDGNDLYYIKSGQDLLITSTPGAGEGLIIKGYFDAPLVNGRHDHAGIRLPVTGSVTITQNAPRPAVMDATALLAAVESVSYDVAPSAGTGSASPPAEPTPTSTLTLKEGTAEVLTFTFQRLSRPGDTLVIQRRSGEVPDNVHLLIDGTTYALDGDQVVVPVPTGRSELVAVLVHELEEDEAQSAPGASFAIKGTLIATGETAPAPPPEGQPETGLLTVNMEPLTETPGDTITGDQPWGDYSNQVPMHIGPGTYLAWWMAVQPYHPERPQDDFLFTGSMGSGGETIVELDGGAGRDVLLGVGGNDTLKGGADSDSLYAGRGDDILLGGDGNDVIFGGIYAHDYSLMVGGPYANGTLKWFYSVDIPDVLRDDQDHFRIQMVNYKQVIADGDDVMDGGAGSDLMDGGFGNDFLQGGEGDGTDIIFGGGDDDFIDGGAGHDRLYGDNTSIYYLISDAGLAEDDPRRSMTGEELMRQGGKDVLNGGDGDDLLFGQADDDVLMGGIGNDFMMGDYFDKDITREEDHGKDWLDGGVGNDVLIGGAEDDELHGGTGNDVLRGDTRKLDPALSSRGVDFFEHQHYVDGVLHGDDRLYGDEGADTLCGDGGNDALYGGSEADSLFGDSPDEELAVAFHGNDYLSGGSGNDTLEGGGGDDQLYGDEDDDVLIGDSKNLTRLPVANHGNDRLYGGDGKDTVIGMAGDDRLFGGAHDDVLYGDGSPDAQVPDASAGDDLLFGEEGDDKLYGGGGNDRLNGGIGADILQGDKGDDWLYGGEGNDRLYGGEGDDLLWGQEGADRLEGGAGHDTYVIRVGGEDRIIDQDENSTIRFESEFVFADQLTPEEASQQATSPGDEPPSADQPRVFGTPLVVSLSVVTAADSTEDSPDPVERQFLELRFSESDRLLLEGGLDARVDKFILADGQELAYEEVVRADRLQLDEAHLSEAAHRYIGTNSNDQLQAPGAGYNVSGGKGADDIQLVDGGNTVYYSAGDGTDTITVNRATVDPDSPNTLKFGEGISATELKLGLGSLAIHVGANPHDVIHIENFDPNDVYGTQAFDRFVFADGTVLSYAELVARGFDINGHDESELLAGTNVDDRIQAGSGDDTVEGRAGNDRIHGGAGDDFLSDESGSDAYFYRLGDGYDVIADSETAGAASVDTLYLGEGIALSSLQVQRNYHDVMLNIRDAEGNVIGGITLQGFLDSPDNQVETIVFANGSRVATASLVEQAEFVEPPGVNIQGSDEIDDILASEGSDYVDAGWGDDTVHGDKGNDTLYGSRDAVPPTNRNGGEGPPIELRTYTDNDQLDGGEGNDWLDGGYSPDQDILKGGTGNDTYLLHKGSGDDTIIESSEVGSNDVILIQDATPDQVHVTRNATDLIIEIQVTNQERGDRIERIRVANHYVDPTVRVEQVIVDNPDDPDHPLAVWDVATLEAMAGAATDLDDYLIAPATGGALAGGLGNDVLVGGVGADTYRVAAQEGVDTIREVSDTAANDVLQLASGINADAVRVFRDGNDLFLTTGSLDHRVVLESWFASPEARIESVQFADGTLWSGADLEQRLQLTAGEEADFRFGDDGDNVLEGLGGDDRIWGRAGADELLGGDGNDRLYGGTEDDVLRGDGGTDALYGEEGNDQLTGGVGDDVLAGGQGDDTYHYAVGDGDDVIDDASGLNTLVLDGVLPEDDFVLRRLADDDQLHIDFADGGSIRVATNQFAIQTIRFADGREWQWWEIADNTLGPVTPHADHIYGTARGDMLDGLGGGDLVYGNGGNDTYVFAAGYQSLSIQEWGGDNNDRLLFKGGIRFNQLTFSAVASDLIVTLGDTAESVVISYFFDPSSSVSTTGLANTVESLVFDDGSVVELNSLTFDLPVFKDLAAARYYGYGADDTIVGTNQNDTIFGGAGNDRLEGGDGFDSLYGGAGNDQLTGSGATSVAARASQIAYDLYGSRWGYVNIPGYQGNAYGRADTLTGGAGDDTYLINENSGMVIIQDTSGNDVIQLGEGIDLGSLVVSFNPANHNGQIRIEYQDSKGQASAVFLNTNSSVKAIRSATGEIAISDLARYVTSQVNGTSGSDILVTGLGPQIVNGNNGDDLLAGGVGRDTLSGGAGSDLLVGGDGNDIITDFTQSNVLVGGIGHDFVSGNGELFGGSGNDTVDGFGLIDAGTGNDSLTIRTTSGGSSAPQVYSALVFGRGYGHDVLTNGGSGNAYILLRDLMPEDIVILGMPTDRGTPSMILQVKGTEDRLVGIDNIKRIEFADGSFWAAEDMYREAVAPEGSAGDDALMGTARADEILGLAGNDYINAGAGNDVVQGGAGRDTLLGGAGNDQLEGSDSSIDFLSGGTGEDTYTLRRGQGVDYVLEVGPVNRNGYAEFSSDPVLGNGFSSGSVAAPDGSATLIRVDSDIAPEEVSVLRNGHDLFLQITDAATGQVSRLVVTNWLMRSDEAGPLRVCFADGTEWGEAVLLEKVGSTYSMEEGNGRAGKLVYGSPTDDTLTGTAAADTLYGYAGDDVLEGGAGNDVLVGGEGHNTYLFGFGSGNDRINSYDHAASEQDVIQLKEGVRDQDVSISFGQNGELVLTLAGGNDSLSLSNWRTSDTQHRISALRFADGHVLSLSGDPHGPLVLTDEANAHESGGHYDDLIYGMAGNDIVDGGIGDDQLHGGAGDDRLSGGAGSNRLEGGLGNDVLISEASDRYHGTTDTIVLGRNTGQDVVSFSGSVARLAGSLIVEFQSDVAADDVRVGLVGQPEFTSTNIVNIRLSLSVNGGDTQLLGIPLQLDLASNLATLPVTVVFADGQEWAGTDILQKALVNRQGDWGNFYAGDNNHPTELRGGQAADYMVGLTEAEAMIGHDGRDWLIGGGGNDRLYGDEGDDILLGGTDDDLLAGGLGNDTLRGGTGHNIYVFERQFGYDSLTLDAQEHATLQFNGTITAKDVMFQVSGKDLIVTLAGESGNQLHITGALSVVDLGSVGGIMARCNLEAIQFGDGERWSANEILNHLGFYTATDDVLVQQGGNYLVSGGLGDDALTGGNANDQLNGGDGNDALTGSAGNDLLLGGVGNDSYYFNAGDGTDEIRDTGSSADSRDTLIFGRGILSSDVTQRVQGNDIILTVNSDRGAVTIRGGLTSDLAIERVLFADGTVLDSRTWQPLPALTLATGAGEVLLTREQQLSRLVFGDGVLPEQLKCTREDDNLVIAVADSSDRWVLQGWFRDSAPTVLVALFATGELWTADDLTRRASVLTGTAGADQLAAPTRIASTLSGAGGDDKLAGGTKADVLLGGAGNDHLDGGFGSDRMQGGTGDDTYLVDNANDAIIEQEGEGRDRVISSISYTLAANTEGLTLIGDSAVAGDGNELDNVIIGNALDNRLTGGQGNDTLDGSAGADYLAGGLGDDSYYIDNFADTLDEGNGGGTDTVYSTITHTLTDTFENLTLIGGGSINGTGNQKDNVLKGNAENNQLIGLAGNDTLDGGVGSDYLVGGTGDDSYFVDNINDRVTENAGEGTDTVYSSISYALGNTLENLTLIGATNVNASGNTGNNVLTGNSGKNLLDGGAGDDTLDGGNGDDTLVGGNGNDTYRFRLQGGIDTVSDATDVNTGTGDRVEFDGDIAPSAVMLTWRQNDLVIAVRSAGDRMIVQNFRTDTSPFTLVFQDGTTWSRTDVLSHANSAPANSAPQLASGIGDMGLSAGVAFSTALPASTFSDPDGGDTLAWRLTLADGSPLPSWLQFDPATLQLSGTPGANNVGLYTLRASVMDAGGVTASTGFLVNIRASTTPNQPPVVTVIPERQVAAEGERFQFLLPSQLFSDADAGDVVTLSATLADGGALPTWLSFDAQTGEFSGVPAGNAAGTWTIQLRGTDKAGDFSTTNFELLVADRNLAPVAKEQLADVLISEDQPFSMTLPAGLFTDPDGDGLSYRLQGLDGQPLPSWLHYDEEQRLLTGTPGRNEIGATSMAIVASDGAGHATEQRFDIVVSHVNHAPMISSSSVVFDVAEGQQLLNGWPADLVVDTDRGDHLTYSLKLVGGSAGPDYPMHPARRFDLLDLSMATDRVSGQPLFQQLSGDYSSLASEFGTRVTNYWDIGTWTYLLTVTDRSGETAQQAITINVSPSEGNHTPYLTPFIEGGVSEYWRTGTKIIHANRIEGERITAYSTGIQADQFFDVDGDVLTYSAVEADGSNSSSDIALDLVNHSISFTIENPDARVFNFFIKATDEDGSVALLPQRFLLNQAPTRNTAVPFDPVINVQEDSSFSIKLPDNLFIDADGDVIDTIITSTPSFDPWPSFLNYDGATHTLWGRAGDYDVRTYRSVVLQGKDPYGGSASIPLTINVINTYDAPRLVSALSDFMATSGQSLAVQAGAAFLEVDPDQTLSYAATLVNGEALPAWLAIDPHTGLLSGTPTEADVGHISLRVSAADLVGGSVSDEFVITVNPIQPNHVPTLSQPIADRAYRADAQFAFSIPQGTFTDVDAYDALSYQAMLANGSSLPSWLHFNAATQSFSGTIPSDLLTPIAITVQAYDKLQASASGSFTLGLATGNSAPYVLSPIAPVNAQEGAALTWKLPSNAFADDDVGEVLTYTVSQADGTALPAWLQFDPVTLTLQGTPLDADVGNLALKVTATDSLGAIAIAPFALEIAGVNEAPELLQALVPPQAVQGQAFSYQIPASTFHDGDRGDSLSYLLTRSDGTALPAWLTFDAVTGTVSGIPANADVGSIPLRLMATDLAGASAATTFVLDVANVNDAPVVADVVVALDEEQAAALTGNLLSAAHDVDVGDELTVVSASLQGRYGELTLQEDGAWQYQPAGAALQALAAGEQAIEHFSYQVTDGQIAVPGVIRFVIEGRNDAPVVVLDQASLVEDESHFTGNILANDQDIDQGTVLTVANAGIYVGQYGVLQLLASGDYRYVPDTARLQVLAEGEEIQDHFVTVVRDGHEAASSALVMTITGRNDAPQVQADRLSLAVVEGMATGNVLTNDSDVDRGSELQVTPVTLVGRYGNLELQADGRYQYTLVASAELAALATGESCTENFAYSVTDGQASVPSTLTVDVAGSNDAPVAMADAVSMVEDEEGAGGSVLANDSDVDHGAQLQIASPGALVGQFGILQLAVDGSYRYQLDNGLQAVQSLAEGDTLTEAFAYQITDGQLLAASVLTITINGRNDAPVAVGDMAALQEDTVSVASGNVLINDHDADEGSTLAVISAGTLQGIYGQLVINGDGSYRYELSDSSTVQALAGDEMVTDTFTYSVSDGDLVASSALTFNITGSNDAPVAAEDHATLAEDAAEVVGNVLGNDRDVDSGSTLAVTAATLQGHYGVLRLEADGSFRYGLDNDQVQSLSGSQSLVETFSYQVTDGQASVAETVAITIQGANDTPVASADTASLSEDTVSLSGSVLANDEDVDSGDVLTVVNPGTYQGQFGTLQLGSDGGYVYQADTSRLQALAAGEECQEQFSYVISDGAGTSTASLLLNIIGTNDAPHVQADVVGLHVAEAEVIGSVLMNDSDVDHGSQLQAGSAAITGQYGSLLLQADGSYRYVLADSGTLRALAQGESVSESFTYQVSDGLADTPSSLNVTIMGDNDAPVAQMDAASLTEDEVGVSGSVLSNDHDMDNGAVLQVAAPGQLQGQYGVLTLSEDGSYAYQLDTAQVQRLRAGQSVSETFAYQVTDGQLQAASALTITIKGSDDAPVAVAETVLLQEDAVLEASGNVLVNDRDVDAGTTLNVRSAGTLQGVHGQLVINTDGSYHYDLANGSTAIQALAAGEMVTESFQYEVADGTTIDSLTANASVTVQIAGSNDAPIVVNAITDKTVNAGQAFSLQLDAATFTDIDHNDVLTWSLTLADGSALPDWLHFDAQTRQLTGTAATGSSVQLDLRAVATDTSGAQAATGFNLAVQAEQGLNLTGTIWNDILTGSNYADRIDGRGGADVMIGKGGDDTYIVDNNRWFGIYRGPGVCDFRIYFGDQVVEKAGEGYDTVRSTVSYVLPGNVEALMLEGSSGISGGGNTLANWITGNNANNFLDGEEGDDHLLGGNGADTLWGDSGIDLLQGGGGNDWLSDSRGNGLLGGGSGADTLRGNDQSNLFIGGQGNDSIMLDGGNDVVAFNRGDGCDRITDAGYAGGNLVVSLGAGIQYADLKFARAGTTLILHAGNSESISFEGWYGPLSNRPTVTLQMVAETMTGFGQTSSNPLLNDKIETFNFNQLAAKLDAQGQGNLWLTPWSLSSALTQFQLAGSDTAALGGNLAYQYGLAGSVAGIGATSAQSELGAISFGSQMQGLKPLSGLAEGISKLE